MTGLHNRRYIRDRLIREFDRSRRYQISISCLLIDLDFFKNVNDIHGNQIGDVVLQRLSQMLIDNTGNSDVVSRYGGEEFLIVLTNTSAKEAVHTAQKIRRLIEGEQITVNDSLIEITASIGVSSLPRNEISESATNDEIIQIADENLYVAKEGGRNQVAS